MNIKPLLLVSVATLTLVACKENAEPEQAATNVALENQTQKLSYVIGMDTGGKLARAEIELDRDAFVAGVIDALEERDPRLSPEDLEAVVQNFQAQQQEKQQQVNAEREEAMREAAEHNAAEGAAFLKENGAKDGVVTTESGLQYKVLEAGSGASPKMDSMVQVNYRGRLVDGTEFDASENHGGAVELRLDQVIPGWTEALQKMQEGAKWELYIPAELAYGPSGTSGLIGPNATLIFEVELVKVVAQ
ncbi:MAG: FKBP-type peptidyl-prolyl cis-trans isomerase [Gammaproteobacteria bacterium]|nr:MAG: FKBP-type peptidyl-prolyl cis-trans isomerase [Gammaproteobacteria bacterium]